jgi:hypothetical protein
MAKLGKCPAAGEGHELANQKTNHTMILKGNKFSWQFLLEPN